MLSISFSFTITLGREQKSHLEKGIVTRVSWKRIRKLIRHRDNETCQICGKSSPDGHVDHILPLSAGGTDAIYNLRWTCPSCNISKNACPNVPIKVPEPSNVEIPVIDFCGLEMPLPTAYNLSILLQDEASQYISSRRVSSKHRKGAPIPQDKYRQLIETLEEKGFIYPKRTRKSLNQWTSAGQSFIQEWCKVVEAKYQEIFDNAEV